MMQKVRRLYPKPRFKSPSGAVGIVSYGIVFLVTLILTYFIYSQVGFSQANAVTGSLIFTVSYALSLLFIPAILLIFAVCLVLLGFAMSESGSFYGVSNLLYSLLFLAAVFVALPILIVAGPCIFLGQTVFDWTGNSWMGWAAGIALFLVVVRFVPFAVVGFILYSLVAGSIAHYITFYSLGEKSLSQYLSGHTAANLFANAWHDVSGAIVNLISVTQLPLTLYIWLIIAGILLAQRKLISEG